MPSQCWKMIKKTHNNCVYIIISQHCDGTGSWKILPQKRQRTVDPTWWPGDTKSQVISSHGIDIVLLLYFCFHSKKVILSGIILWMHPANERWRYNVTSSLIGWALTQNDPCTCGLTQCGWNTIGHLSYFISMALHAEVWGYILLKYLHATMLATTFIGVLNR